MEVNDEGDGLNCVPPSGGDDCWSVQSITLEYGSTDCWVSCGGVKELVTDVDRVVW